MPLKETMQYRSKRESPASSYVEFFFESAGECLTDKVLQSGPETSYTSFKIEFI